MIAFFGTGLLGSGFVRALLRRGEAVHVWNRTAEKARRLEADGAKAIDDPAAAARGAERVHLSLSDDAAVDDVLERALPGIAPSALIVDHTTTSASGTVARVMRWNERGFRFVHAPVFMGPQNALDSTGLMLVSGERGRVEVARPHLERMTGKLVDLGERVDAAAAFKLLGNLFLMFLTSGLSELFTLARAMNIEPREAATLFDHFNPGLTLGARVERMLGGDWSKPSWELAMARKDARLMLEEASGGARPLSMLPAIAARMDALIAQGHGGDDWTVLAKDALGDEKESVRPARDTA
jgi:3-hydroxyisobutyrate dehydrogenase